MRPPAPVARVDQRLPHDADAERAMAWLQRGMPQDEIVYDDAVPRQSATELAKFRPAGYRREGLPEGFTREIRGASVNFRAIARSGIDIKWLVVRGDSASPPRTVHARQNAKPETVVAKYLATA